MIHSQNKIITKSAEETQSEGEKFATLLQPGDIVLLHGDLGAGKTTFTQGLAKGLGIKERIISPTFVIIRSHEQFYHVDLYRLSSEQEIVGTGLLDILKEKNSIVVIEWPERMGKFLPVERIDVQCEYIDEDKRKIVICKN